MSVPPKEEDAVVSQTGTGLAACPGGHRPEGQRQGRGSSSQRPALRNEGPGCHPGARGPSKGVLGRSRVAWLAGWAACAQEKEARGGPWEQRP